MPRPREVFLSHAHQDRRLAARLAATLKRHGVPVWYSPVQLQGAQQWHDEIGKALARCDWFALMLSPAAVRSEWVKRELFYALRNKRYRKRIVPLVFKACDHEALSWTLGSIQQIDFTSGPDAGYDSLLKVWRITYRPETAATVASRPPRARRESSRRRR